MAKRASSSSTPPPVARWGLALSGADPAAAARWLLGHGFAGRAPARLSIDAAPRRAGSDWVGELLADPSKTRAAFFDEDGDETLVLHPSGTVSSVFAWHGTPAEALAALQGAPFEIASFLTRFDDWTGPKLKYRAPGFSRNHYPHGWGCAFKGAGHDRLVSRRWLDHGPWRLLRGDGDTTLVQFHAWNAGAREALEQAKPGHQAMGIGEHGGFVQQPYPFTDPMHGLYDADEQSLRVVVAGRRLTPRETLDACAALQQGALAPEKPLKRFIYVFTDPGDARTWLPALWLRGLECWTIENGVEKRLDADYVPAPPQPPAWAEAG